MNLPKASPPDGDISSAKAVIIMTAVVFMVFGIVGAVIWLGWAGADYRYLTCMSCHM